MIDPEDSDRIRPPATIDDAGRGLWPASILFVCLAGLQRHSGLAIRYLPFAHGICAIEEKRASVMIQSRRQPKAMITTSSIPCLGKGRPPASLAR